MELLNKKVLGIIQYDLGIIVNSLDEKIEFESIQEVELVISLEEEFEISIPDEDVDLFGTANDIIKYVRGKCEEKSA